MDAWARCQMCDQPTPMEDLMAHDFECYRCRMEGHKDQKADEANSDQVK